MAGWCVHTVRCEIDATVACTLTYHLAQCAAQQPTYPGNLDICSLCIGLCPGGSLHAGFIFPAGSSHALIVGFCVHLTAQSVGWQLWGSAGSWSDSIVAHCKDSSNWVMVAVLYHELESLRLAWMHWRAHASWGRELAAVDCMGSMLTLKASLAPYYATGTHCPWKACARADLWMGCWCKKEWEVPAWLLTVAEFWLKGHGAVELGCSNVGGNNKFWKPRNVVQHINATVNLCIAATQNTTCVHNCRVPIVFCLILVVCVQCLLRIVALISQHPVCTQGGAKVQLGFCIHIHPSRSINQPYQCHTKTKVWPLENCDQSKSVTNTPECSLCCKRCCDSVYEIATARLACRSGNRHMS